MSSLSIFAFVVWPSQFLPPWQPSPVTKIALETAPEEEQMTEHLEHAKHGGLR